jgi:transcriptional regulator with XRE-family HTH domain
MFSKRFRALRLGKGWNIPEAARQIGVSTETIHTYERDTTPNFKYLAKIAKVLDVSLEYLVTGSDKKTKVVVSSYDWFKKYYASASAPERKKIHAFIEQTNKKKSRK